uniref:Uncharacterized protein n=1 Tax=Romanomermis culicivorax TaxID=13658 RepID=A0A915K456_ROMCU
MASLFYKLFLVSNFECILTFKYVDFLSSFNFTDNDDPFNFGQLRSPPALALKIPQTGSLKTLASPTTVVDSTAKNGIASKKANELKFENDNDSRLFPTEAEKVFRRKNFLSKVLHFSNVNGTDVYGLDSQTVNVLMGGEDSKNFSSTTLGPFNESQTTNTPKVTAITPRKFLRFWSRNLKTTTPPKSTFLPVLRPSRTIFPSVKAVPNRIKGNNSSEILDQVFSS